jgi:hypothetical protein
MVKDGGWYKRFWDMAVEKRRLNVFGVIFPHASYQARWRLSGVDNETGVM